MSQWYYVRRCIEDDDPIEADELKRLVAADPELRWGKGGIEWRASDPGYASIDKEEPGDPDAVFLAGGTLSCCRPDDAALGKLAQIAKRLEAKLFHELSESDDDDLVDQHLESYPPGLDAMAAEEAAARKPKPSASAPPRAYSPRDAFEEGERIAHEKFGVGVIKAAEPSKITVEFPGAVKKLAQRMK